MATSKLSSKYQIVIPKEIRSRMKLHAGSVVTVHPVGTQAILVMHHGATSTESLKGLGKDVWRSLGGGTKYLKQERRSWQKKANTK